MNSTFSNFIHIETSITEEVINKMSTLGLQYFSNIDNWWNWTEEESKINYLSFSLLENNIFNSFIKNISFFSHQEQSLQILFVEKNNDENENEFYAIKKNFIIPKREILSFQNVMILGFYYELQNGDSPLWADMTITNAAIENNASKKGKKPIWETLFGVVLPYIPDINSLESLFPQEQAIENYKGIIGGIEELMMPNVTGFINDVDTAIALTNQKGIIDTVWGTITTFTEDDIVDPPFNND